MGACHNKGSATYVTKGRNAVGTRVNDAPISKLQQVVNKSRTSDLIGAYDQLADKRMAQMTNEEKMVRAVVTDELLHRGNLLYDPKTGNYDKYKKSNEVVFYNEKSYRIKSIKKVEDNTGKKVEVADAEWYYNGKFSPVKNYPMLKDLAKEYRKKER